MLTTSYPGQLCSRVRDVIDQSSSLKYQQALVAANMIDGSGLLSSTQRLQKLELTERAWSRLAWRQDDVVRLDLPYSDDALRRLYGKSALASSQPWLTYTEFRGSLFMWKTGQFADMTAFTTTTIGGPGPVPRLSWSINRSFLYRIALEGLPTNNDTYKDMATFIEATQDLLVTAHECVLYVCSLYISS
jgi:hypothetical protein